MPDIIIVAGPNGAGKTSFAREYLPLQRKRYVYINADEIELEPMLGKVAGMAPQVHAGRLMLLRIDEAVARLANVMIETTLATRMYSRKIRLWRKNGYTVGLVYLRLPTVEDAIERVRRRVLEGGHDIPVETIRRRFIKSRSYLDSIYKPLVDEWYVWESVEGDFIPAEMRSGS